MLLLTFNSDSNLVTCVMCLKQPNRSKMICQWDEPRKSVDSDENNAKCAEQTGKR